MEACVRSAVLNCVIVCLLATICRCQVDVPGPWEYDLALAANLDPPAIFVAPTDTLNFTVIPGFDAHDQVRRPVAIDYDPVDAMVYWTDVQHSTINRAFLDGTGFVVILQNLQAPDGLALDVFNRFMYWTDTGSDLIERATLDGQARTIVLNLTSAAGTIEPRAIVLDATNSHLYWTDWGSAPKIERADIDGSDRRVLVNTDLQWPNGLAVDVPGGRLYWCDAGLDRIESSDLLGQNRRTIVDLAHYAIHPFDIAFYRDGLFTTDWRFTKILRVTFSPVQENALVGSETFQKGGGIHMHTDTFSDHGCVDLMPCGVGERCRQFETSYECICMDGPDGTNCTLPNPCTASPCRNGGNCLQSTTNSGSYFCQCPNRYSGNVCEIFRPWKYDLVLAANLDPPAIFVATTDTLNFTVIPGFDAHDQVRRPIAIDYDPVDAMVYWTDVQHSTINRAFLDGTGFVVILRNLQTPDGLALDVINRVMYWTDTGSDLIERATLDGQARTLVLNLTSAAGTIEPRAIVLDATNSHLYWTDWGSAPKIERAGIDGSDHRVLVNTSLQWPNGLAVDVPGGRLYWCDAGLDRIDTSDLLGQNRRTIADLTSYAIHPFDIAFYRGDLFWTDWRFTQVLRVTFSPVPEVTQIGSQTFQKGGGIHMHTDTFSDHGCVDLMPCGEGQRCRQFETSYECICMDGPDGTNCTLPNPCTASPCRNGGNCLQSNSGSYFCQCPNRYSGNVCEIFNNPCSSSPCKNGATCIDSSDDFTCSCPFQFIGTTCSVERRPYDLVFATNLIPPGIFVAPTDTFNFTLIPGSDNHIKISRPVAIDYDPVDGMIYWTDFDLSTINRAFLDGTGFEIIADVQVPEGLALDPKNRIMYWTDSGTDLIERATLNGQNRSVIHNLNDASRSEVQPRAIVLDPQNGYLYWTDVGSNPRIERSRINGSDRSILVNTSLQLPNGLALDVKGGRMFWCDAFYDQVEFTDLLGRNRTIIADLTAFQLHPYDLAFHYGFVYWTDWRTHTVLRVDVPRKIITNHGSNSFQQAGGLHIYQDTGTDHSCRDSSPCLNGGFCRQFATSYECVCADGFSGMNCQIAENLQFVGGCPDDISTKSDILSSSVSVSWSVPQVTSSSVPLDLSSSHEPGDMFAVGDTTVVTYTVTSSLGKSAMCNFTVAVSGVGLDCPESSTWFTPLGSATANVSWALPSVIFTGPTLDVMFYVGQPSTQSTSDDNGQVLVYSEYPSTGDAFDISVRPIIYRVQGLATQCRFDVSVVDNEPPAITNCPDDVILPVSSPSDHASYNWAEPIISDNSGDSYLYVDFRCMAADLTLECRQDGSGMFAAGLTKILYNATDLSGNWNMCSFTVMVKVVGIKCPEDPSVLAIPDFRNTSVSWSEPVLTGWNGPTNFTSTSVPGDVFFIGRHKIRYTQWFAAFRLNCAFFVGVVGQCKENYTRNINWKATSAGLTARSNEVCRLNTENAGDPVAVRTCSVVEAPLYFQWEEPQLQSCGTKTIDTIDTVKNVTVSEGNVAEVAKFLANTTSGSTDDARNVEAVSTILENIVGAESGDRKVTELVFETVNSIITNIEATPDVPPNAASSSSIVQSVQSQVSLTLRQEDRFSIQQDNLQVEAVTIDADRASQGLTFASVPQQSSQPGEGKAREGSLAGTEVKTFTNASEIPEDRVASVVLPANIFELLQIANGNTSTKLQASFIVYADDTLFRSALINQSEGVNGSRLLVVGSVVSLTVENVPLVNLTEPVVIEFRAPSRSIPAENITSIKCVFWDFDRNDKVGDWSTLGCTLARNTSAIVSCHCGHATNFAILVDVKGQKHPPKPFDQALDIISQIGCVLSIIALVITLGIYLSFRKLRTGKSRQIFIHFCASLLMLYIVFLAGIDSAKGSGGGCVFVAALLHYLTLTSMMWMAVEARNMYVSTVKVFPEDDSWYMVKACLIAWGSPLILVVITLAAATKHYKNEHYCFLEPDLVLYLALLVPIGLILIHNIITFILVMRSLLNVKEVSRSAQISKRLQNAVGISALMGLTWVFGFLAINEAAVVFQVIFCLANSTQGVIVFVMFCARREEVRVLLAPYIKRICCKCPCRMPEVRPDRNYDLNPLSESAPSSPTSVQTDQFEMSLSGTNSDVGVYSQGSF